MIVYSVRFVEMLALAAVVFLILKAVGVGLRLLTKEASAQARVRRIMSTVEAVALLVFLVFAVSQVFTGDKNWSPAAELVLAVVIAASAWFALRDLAAGFIIRAGDTLRPGDKFAAGDVKGTVQRLGYRVLVLESEQGEEVFVPYSRVQSATVTRAPRSFGAFGHAFSLRLPEGMSAAEGARAIKRAALMCHWHSPVKEVQLDPGRDGSFMVRVFALHPLYGAEIEAEVRAAIKKPMPA